MSENEKEQITVHNGSSRVFRTRAGVLPIGGSLTLDAEEAKDLLQYAGIRDAAKLAPQQAETIVTLKSRVALLERENADLKREVGNLRNTEAPIAAASAEDADEPEAKEKTVKRRR